MKIPYLRQKKRGNQSREKREKSQVKLKVRQWGEKGKTAALGTTERGLVIGKSVQLRTIARKPAVNQSKRRA